MLLYENEQLQAFRDRLNETKVKRSKSVLAEGDTESVYFFLKLESVIQEDYAQIFLHNKEDVESEDIYTNGFLHNERCITISGNEKRTVVVECYNITGNIKFGMIETTQNEMEMFKKKRTQLITDVSEPKQFNPNISYMYRRTVIIQDTDMTTGDYTTKIVNQLHIYDPDNTELVKFVTNA